jgi:two-component system, OmpR family, response regulator MtrA
MLRLRRMMARILVADDSAPLRLLVARVLALRGHAVTEAADGDRALAALRRDRPDVAILDVVMPGLSGLEVCGAARADPTLADVGIVILSANASGEQAREAGADRFVAKPFLPSDLLAAIDDVIAAGASAREALRRAPERP